MRRLAFFIYKMFYVKYMGDRYIFTGEMPSREERIRFLGEKPEHAITNDLQPQEKVAIA